MTPNDPTLLSLTEVAEAIRSKKITSVEVTEACLARIAKHDSKVNSFISLEREAVLKMAREADKALARGEVRGPLHGVPLAH